jgi:hypothetical protein
MAGGFGVARDEPVLVEDLVVGGAFLHTDRLAHVFDRDRIARCAQHHQSIVGDLPHLHPLVMIRRPGAQRCQLLVGKAIDRPFMGGSVNAQVGHLEAPALQPAVEFIPGVEAPARQSIALHILHSALDLTFSPRPVRLAGARGEAVVACEILEQRMPQDLVFAAAQHQSARVIVQTCQSHSA